MKRALLLCLLAIFTFSGCGEGDIVVDDLFFDDDVGDLIAIDDNFSTFQNRTLTVGDANGVLRNDIICCDDFDIFYDSVSARGGTVLGRDDGSFNYTPPANFIGTDSFVYTLEDDFGFSDGVVTIVVETPPPVGFFVDSQTGSDTTGSGVSGAPFATIQAAVAAAGTNTSVTVRVGDGTAYSGTVSMQTGQTLQGAVGAGRPRLQGPVNMADNCSLQNLRVENSPAVAVDGRGRNAGEVLNCQFVGAGDFALDLVSAQGRWDIENNVVENCLGGVDASVAGTAQLSILLRGNAFQNNTQNAILLTSNGNADLVAGLFSNIFTNNQNGSTVSAATLNTAGICLDMTGNQNDDVYLLTDNSNSFQVEQLAQLGTLNTGTVTVGANPLQSVADGFCGF